MIISSVLVFIFTLIAFIIGLIPDLIMANDTFDITSLSSLIAIGFRIFPVDLFKLCISNVTFWLSFQLMWAIIEWCYKKLPGVN